MTRQDWLRACALARSNGPIRATLPNLVAAYRVVQERWPDLRPYCVD